MGGVVVLPVCVLSHFSRVQLFRPYVLGILQARILERVGCYALLERGDLPNPELTTSATREA